MGLEYESHSGNQVPVVKTGNDWNANFNVLLQINEQDQ